MAPALVHLHHCRSDMPSILQLLDIFNKIFRQILYEIYICRSPAVLVAEELFASGCQLLISITSAGQIMPVGQPPYFVLIERALRDEGTSYHYLPPSPFSALRPELEELLRDTWEASSVPMHSGASWTTDAPFRETEEMIQACRANGILAVEMEAAALYALAQAKQSALVCFAHVTNQMAEQGDDFEKGPNQGSRAALQVIDHTARHLHYRM